MNKDLNLTTILVVDDEAVIRQSFSDHLEDLDYRVLTAENGAIGLEMIKQHHPDLVLTDMIMPELDGLSFISEVKLMDPELPVIVISGAGNIADAIEAIRLGAYDYLVKPVNDLELLEHCVQRALNNTKLIQENQRYQTDLEHLVQERTQDLENANAQLNSLNNRLKSVVQTASRLSSCTDVKTIGQELLLEFSSHMSANGGSAYVIGSNGLELLGSIDSGHAAEYLPMPTNTSTVFGTVISSKQSLLIDDIQHSPIQSSGWGDYTSGSALTFPVLDSGGNPVAVIALHNKENPPFTEQDKEIGGILASFCAETLRATSAFHALSQNEQKYRTLFDRSNDAIFVIDRTNGRFLDANGVAENLTGRTLKELKNLTNKDIAPDGARERLERVNKSTGFVDQGEVTILRPDQSCRIVHLRTVLGLDNETVVGIAKDITAELETEKQLRLSQKMKALGQLTGGIAHDFNNILAIILGNISLIQSTQTDPKISRRIEAIDKSARRAADLTKQLLGFSRQQAARTTTANINQLIFEMTTLVNHALTPEISLIDDFEKELWDTDIDPGDFEDALLNMVINARDAMPTGGQLRISTHNTLIDGTERGQRADIKPGAYVELTLSDTGIGIEKNNLERVFEPFFTTKPQGKGTGLGLAMVFGFIKRSKGRILIDSKEGEGCTISIYLPKSGDANNSKPKQALVAQKEQSGSGTILVVDDEEELQELAEEYLSSKGFKVLTASNGHKALDVLSKNPKVDLLFSDIIMPGEMNGYELSRAAHEKCPDLKVLLTSGHAGRAATDVDHQALNKNILAKPYTLNGLLSKVNTLLNNRAPNNAHRLTQHSPPSRNQPKLHWSEDYSIGIHPLDTKREQLIELINQSQATLLSELKSQEMRAKLDQLWDKTVDFFKHEETVMTSYQYPALVNHLQVHRLLIKEMELRLSKLGKEHEHVKTLLEFLVHWWIDHIRGMDRAFICYWKEQAKAANNQA